MDILQKQLLIALIIIPICLIITVYITITSLHQLCIRDSSSWINIRYRNLTIIIMLLFVLSTIGDLMHIIIIFNGDWESGTFIQPESMLVISVDAVYFAGNIVFYMLLLSRISQPFELHICILFGLSFLVFISAVASIAYCICFPLISQNSADTEYWALIRGILSADDLILNMVILIVFVYKMRKTVAGIDVTVSIEAAKNANLITNLLIKHSILFGIALILNQAWIGSNVYYTLAQDYSIMATKIISYSLRALETTTNVLVLWLVLRINHRKYVYLCKCCHICAAKHMLKNSNSNTAINGPYHRLDEF
eukprot:20701_1